eukprot:m.120117 g.120117  ORF g.120117 m.120117 type:complete len:613 (-) comp15607_c0_seq1:73-1911(-)
MASRRIEQAALVAAAISPFIFFWYMIEAGFTTWQDYHNLAIMEPVEWNRFMNMLEQGSALCSLATLVFANAFLSNFARVVEMVVFRQLRDQELKYALEESINFLILKVVVIWATMEMEPNLGLWSWLAWFMWTGWLLAFASMCKCRLKFAMSSPTTMGGRQHRVLALLGLVMLLSVASTVITAQRYAILGSNFLLIWAFDGVSNTLLCLKSFASFGIQQLDLSRGLTDAEKLRSARSLFYLDMSSACFHFLHCIHLMWLHGFAFTPLDLILFIKARSRIELMRGLLRNHQRFMRMTKRLANMFQPASSEELLANQHDPCAICRDTLDSGCKLACGHLFHQACIQQWAARQATCPTCRTPLLDPSLDQSASIPARNEPPLTAATAALNGQPERPPSPSWLGTDANLFRPCLLPITPLDILQGVGRALFNIRIAVRVGRRQPQASQREHHAISRLQEMFPNMPEDTLRQDLRQTRSLQITLERILTGQLVVPPSPSTSDVAQEELPPPEVPQAERPQPHPRGMPPQTPSTSPSATAATPSHTSDAPLSPLPFTDQVSSTSRHQASNATENLFESAAVPCAQDQVVDDPQARRLLRYQRARERLGARHNDAATPS